MMSIVSAVARQFLGTMFFNAVFIAFYILILTFVKGKLEKQSDLRENATGIPGKTTREMFEEIILVSLVSGFLISIAVVFIGISLDISAFQYLFLIMLALFIINPRFVCFSYAGGLLALIGIIFKVPGLNPASLIALIAIAHLAESVLILLFGTNSIIPVYIKHENGIAGAFIIQKFWPLPLIFVASGIQSITAGGMEEFVKADWWPLFKSFSSFASSSISTFTSTAAGIATSISASGGLALGLGSLAAFLSYSDMAVSSQPEDKGRERAYLDLGYAVLLFVVSFFARDSMALQIIGALAAILAHEGISLFGKLRENSRKPLFMAERRGLKVFDVAKGTHAHEMGMRRGDTVLNVNGRDIQSVEGLIETLKDYPNYLWVKVKTPDGAEKLLEHRSYPEGVNNLGILTIPREQEVTYNIDYFENFAIIRNLVARFRAGNKPV